MIFQGFLVDFYVLPTLVNTNFRLVLTVKYFMVVIDGHIGHPSHRALGLLHDSVNKATIKNWMFAYEKFLLFSHK